ncbi:putative Ig domain-containing protein [uncultured Thalassolituus sp.]|uniref:putative Ig domain-containing protein n=1 Tax=uncultured Thalassolituus sp. TaxID=285273 RepID=UPI00261AB370|nr:putative Ig domain-containing protein [uncultured Thalassolituus sp.]
MQKVTGPTGILEILAKSLIRPGAASASLLMALASTSYAAAPVFTSPAAVEITEDEALSLTLTASDDDGDPLSFSLPSGQAYPAGLVLSGADLSSDAVSITPAAADITEDFTFDISVEVTDGETLVPQTITVTVRDAEIKVVTDAAGGANSVSASDLNAVESVSGAIVANEAAYQSAIAGKSATDLDTAAEIQALINTVNSGESVPVFSSDAAFTITEGDSISHTLVATDSNGDSLTYSLKSGQTLPANIAVSGDQLSSDAVNTDTSGDAITADTSINVVVEVTDGTNTVEQTIVITVRDAELKAIMDAAGATNGISAVQLNAVEGVSGAIVDNETAYQTALAGKTSEEVDTPAEIQVLIDTVNSDESVPVFTSDAAFTITENDSISHTLVATDSNGDTLTYSLKSGQTLPANIAVSGDQLSSDAVNTDASGNAITADASINVVVEVSDGTNTVEQTIVITVRDAELKAIMDAAGATNGISAVQLNAVEGVSGAIVDNETAYQTALAGKTSEEVDTPAEIQVLIDTVNSDESVPVFTSDAAFTITENDSISHTLVATDSNGDALIYSLQSGQTLPANIAVSGDQLSSDAVNTDASGNVITADTSINVVVEVTDGTNTVEQTIVITVLDAQLKAIMDAAGAANTVTAVQLNAVEGVSGAIVDNETAYQTALAGKTSAEVDTPAEIQALINTVNSDESVPVFSSDAAFTITEGDSISHTLVASDSNGDALTYSLKAGQTLPANIAVSGDQLSSDAVNTDASGNAITADTSINVVVEVTDGTNTVEQTIVVTVLDAELKAIMDAAGAANTVTAVQLNAVEGVSGAIADNEAAYQSAIAGKSATELDTAAEIQALIDTVNSGESVPVFTSDAAFTITENDSISHTLVATDSNGDSLTYSLKSGQTLPANIAVSGDQLGSDAVNTDASGNAITADTSINVVVEVTDGTNTVEQTIVVTVLDAELKAIMDAAGAANTVTAVQLNAVEGVSGAIVDNEAAYQSAIAGKSATELDTAAEIQALIDTVNSDESVPVFSSDAAFTITEGDSISHTLVATDSNGDSLTYSLKSGQTLPANISVSGDQLSSDAVNTDASGNAVTADISINVVVEVTDGTNTVEQTIVVTVLDAELKVIMDAAGTTNTITVAQLNAVEGVSGAIADNEAAYQTALAGKTSEEVDTAAEIQALIDTVNSGESVPVFTSDAAFTITENDSISHTLVATDSNGDTLTYSFKAGQTLPANIAVSGDQLSSDALITDAAGDAITADIVISVVVEVTDGASTVEQTITVTVLDLELKTVSDAAGTENLLTATQLNSVEGVSGALEENETAYQAAIAALAPEDFDTPAKIQGLVDSVNSGESIPEFTSATSLVIVEGESFSLQLSATDSAGDSLVFSLQEGQVLPAGITLSGNTLSSGLLTEVPDGQPVTDDISFDVVVEVTDGTNVVAQTITVTVRDKEIKVIREVAGAANTITAAQLNAVAGMEGRAITDNESAYRSAIASRSSVDLDTSEEIIAMVEAVNSARSIPEFTSGDAFTLIEGESASFTLTATDDNGDELTYRLKDDQVLPANFRVSGDLLESDSVLTDEFGVAITSDIAFDVIVEVSDGVNTVEDVITVTVRDAEIYAISSVAGDPANGVTVTQLNAVEGMESSAIAGNQLAYQAAVGEASPEELDSAAEIIALVAGVNTAESVPEFVSTDTLTITENDSVSLLLEAQDANGDSLTYSLKAGQSLPASFRVENQRLISDAVTTDAAGEPITVDVSFAVIVEVTDGVNTVEQTITVTALDAQLKTVMDAAGASNTITASQLNAVEGVSGALEENNSKYQAVIARLTAEDLNTAAEIQAVVHSVNSVPVITSSAQIRVVEDSSLIFDLTATDAAGDALTFSIPEQPRPGWVRLIAGSPQSLIGSPSDSDVGQFSLIVEVSDGFGNIVSQTISIRVLDKEINKISEAAGGENVITADDLNAVEGIDSAIAARQAQYRDAISALQPADLDSFDEISALVNSVNSDPEFTSVAAFSVIEGDDLGFTVIAIDDAGDRLTLSLVEDNSNAGFVTLTQTMDAEGEARASLSGAPADVEVGSFTVRVQAGDAYGNTETQLITVTVQDAEIHTVASAAGEANSIGAADLNAVEGVSGAVPENNTKYQAAIARLSYEELDTPAEIQSLVDRVNTEPVITSPDSAFAIEQESFSFVFEGTDAEGNDLTFTLVSGLPAWLSFDGTATLSGVPQAEDIGFVTLEVSATDGVNVLDQQLAIEVIDAEIYRIRAVAGETEPGYLVTAADLNSVDGVSGAIEAKEGQYQQLIAGLTEAELDTPEEIQQLVNSVNSEPEYTGDPAVTVVEAQALSFPLQATDSADDDVHFAIVSAPAWVRMGEGYVLGGTPANADVGVAQVTVRMSDDYLNASDVVLSITVVDKEIYRISSAAGDEDNTVTAANLNAVEGVTGAIQELNAQYQAAIAQLTADDLDTAAEIQSLVNSVNYAPEFVAPTEITLVEGDAIRSLLEGTDQSGDDVYFSIVAGQDLPDANLQIVEEMGAVYLVSEAVNEDQYGNAVTADTSFVVTVEVDDGIYGNQVQADILVTLLDREIFTISSAVGDSTAAQALTVADFQSVAGLANVYPENIAAYQSAVLNAVSAADLAEIQSLVDAVNINFSITSAGVTYIARTGGGEVTFSLTGKDSRGYDLSFAMASDWTLDWIYVDGNGRLAVNPQVGEPVVVNLVATDGVYEVAFTVTLVVSEPGRLVVNGTEVEGQTLIAAVDDPDGISGEISYSWRVDGYSISSSATLTLGSAEVGQTVNLKVTYTDDAGDYQQLTYSTGVVVSRRAYSQELIDDFFSGVPAQEPTPQDYINIGVTLVSEATLTRIVSILNYAVLQQSDIADIDTTEEIEALIEVIMAGQDYDNDGLPNHVEGTLDEDDDGVPDERDEYDIDTDRDGVADWRDLDSDHDGMTDGLELFGYLGLERADTDGDGIDDWFDATPEGGFELAEGVIDELPLDGVDDRLDTLAELVVAYPGLDKDSDGLVNWRDLDADNDGIIDLIEAGFRDLDENGKRDPQDTSISSLLDLPDSGTTYAVWTGTAVTGTDSDGDGILDAFDNLDGYGLQSNGAFDQAPDNDNDGVPDDRDVSVNEGVDVRTGSGGGSMGSILLAGLAVLLMGLRGRSFRSLLMAGMLMGAVQSSHAALNIGGAVGFSWLTPEIVNDDLELDRRLGIGGQISLGYRLNEQFGVLATATELGQARVNGAPFQYSSFGTYVEYHPREVRKGLWGLVTRFGMNRLRNVSGGDGLNIEGSTNYRASFAVGAKYTVKYNERVEFLLTHYAPDAQMFTLGYVVSFF